MKNTTLLNSIRKQLPGNIIIEDSTEYEFNDDELLSILSWIKLFNQHYKAHGISKVMPIQFPVISKRIHLDFGLYTIPCDLIHNKGKHVIYINANGKRLDGSINKGIKTTELIRNFNL